MKRIFFPVAALLLGVMTYSCQEEVGNPGDFNLKSTLEVTGITTASGTEYPWEVVSVVDSAIVRTYFEYDTLKDASGKPVIGSDGKYTITTDTVEYVSNTKCKIVDISEIVLEPNVDTVRIELKSNAKWNAPMPELGTPPIRWFVTQNMSGGGDGTVIAAVPRNKNVSRPNKAVQHILTADSAVIYRLTFGQKGEKDKK